MDGVNNEQWIPEAVKPSLWFPWMLQAGEL